ncbi:uncharacterized protein LOC128559789 [Mercenaria mercenaria]|uniref:uncharacterized protein LOC128559789 n=1 Tax=Mercenaria mercenaria TaxID=6596 RepID=UPI00234EC14F|nr:uncharacterized protein LOC128559789 [Mercenaria mercenaria]
MRELRVKVSSLIGGKRDDDPREQRDGRLGQNPAEIPMRELRVKVSSLIGGKRVIPFDGAMEVNGVVQKKWEDVRTEILVAHYVDVVLIMFKPSYVSKTVLFKCLFRIYGGNLQITSIYIASF